MLDGLKYLKVKGFFHTDAKKKRILRCVNVSWAEFPCVYAYLPHKNADVMRTELPCQVFQLRIMVWQMEMSTRLCRCTTTCLPRNVACWLLWRMEMLSSLSGLFSGPDQPSSFDAAVELKKKVIFKWVRFACMVRLCVRANINNGANNTLYPVVKQCSVD